MRSGIVGNLVKTTLWLVALLLLLDAWHWKSPYLLRFRQYEMVVQLIMATICAVFAIRLLRGFSRTCYLSMLATAILLISFAEGKFLYRKSAVLRMDQRTAALGQHFVVGYNSRDKQALRTLVAKGLVGGIFITQRNVHGKSIAGLREEIAELQSLRQSAGLPGLIVATDQEGGMVSRLSPPLTMQPSLGNLLAQSRTGAEAEARAAAFGEMQGRELAALGITVNFSPVVDLKSAHKADFLDRDSQIASRAISADPALTTRMALAYSRSLAEQGVRPTLKHFPGLGQVNSDTHHFSAQLNTPIAELSAHDWLPFKQIAEHSTAMIMLGHVVLPALDKENPASFSYPVIQDIIRNSWGYEGVLITDDLVMAPAYDRGLCQVAVKALNAGVDLLLVAYDFEQYYEAMYCANQAYRERVLSARLLDKSSARIARIANFKQLDTDTIYKNP